MIRDTTFTSNTTLEIADDGAMRAHDEFGATIQISGTFGGGTLALYVSLDGGTTKNAIKDSSGTAYTTTSADTIVVRFPVNPNETNLKLYATLSGATNPNISVRVASNK